MFKSLLVCVVIVSAFHNQALCVEAETIPCDTVAWDQVLSCWNAYLEYPSTQNAALLYELLPERAVCNRTDSLCGVAIDSLYNELAMLERQVRAGDKIAVAVAFRLMAIADGEFAEWLCIMLGQLIRPTPRLFLEQLKEHEHLVTRLDCLVGNQGYEFVDRWQAMELETELRIEAIEGVEDSSLTEVRDKCLTELRSQLDWLRDVEW